MRALFLAVPALALLACGGGGSSTPDAAPGTPDAAETIDANVDVPDADPPDAGPPEICGNGTDDDLDTLDDCADPDCGPHAAGCVALSFDGTDDFVNAGQVAGAKVTAGTIEAWVYIDAIPATGSTYIIDADSCGGNYLRLDAGGKLSSGFWECFTASPSANVITAKVFPLHEWHHIARTWDGTNLKIYVDGVEDGSVAMDPAAVNLGGLAVHFGHRHSNASNLAMYFHGRLDEVRVWNVARSQTEIAANMSVALTPPITGLIGYWPINENTGETTADTSGANHPGVFQPSGTGPTWTDLF